ncbi:MAG: YidC/Oxa1 family membrane protein insertase [Coriobacteriales bacterium]|nr:YidC/Oxa1 family membrane protein insertase [Coriobacteriales bacterium]
MAIILITLLIRILLYPITRKQFHSSYKMQKMQPRLNEIKEKYADDKQRLQEEQMKLYAEAKFNPLSGCLPMLLQMPIFIALYQVLLELQQRAGEGAAVTFYGLIPDLTVGPRNVFSFTPEGMLAVVPYLILVVLFGVSMLIPLIINKTRERQQLIMTGVMALMMIWFGWMAPAGVLLYWDVSSLIGVGQQVASRKLLERKDALEEEVEIKPVKVEVDRKERKNRPKKTK